MRAGDRGLPGWATIAPDRPDLVARILQAGLLRMVRRGLRGVWRRGEMPRGQFVWAANHHSWWDPFCAAALLDRHRREPCLIMLQENLEQYTFLRRLGVFGTAEARRGLTHLARDRVLVIYPEGELRPAGALGDLADGAAWYARRSGAPLCAVATRVLARGHQAPEAYLSFAPLDGTGTGTGTGTVGEVTRRLRRVLGDELAALDALAARADPRQALPGFRLEVAGRRSWEERLEVMLRWHR